MKYESTRGASPTIGFTDAMLAGLATDGGLYVPKSWAPLPTERSSNYASLAAEIVSLYAGGELSEDEGSVGCVTRRIRPFGTAQ